MTPPAEIRDPILTTHIAWAGFEDHQFCGYAVFGELAGRESFTSLVALSITGRRLPPDEVAMIDDLAVVSTMPDPRIWPLKISSLVAAYGDSVIAGVAGCLCLGQAMLGPCTAKGAAELLVRLRRSVGDAELDDAQRVAAELVEIVRSGERLAGFGVALRPTDERLEALGGCVARRGRADLPYWRLLGRASDAVHRLKGLSPNLALGIAAVLLDLGFSPDETSVMAVALFEFHFLAIAFDRVRQLELEGTEVLRRVPSDRVRYVGHASRQSPRFARATTRK